MKAVTPHSITLLTAFLLSPLLSLHAATISSASSPANWASP
jgi:hypothetical protein